MIRKHWERGFDYHKYRRKVRNFETVVLLVLHSLIVFVKKTNDYGFTKEN